MRVFLIAIALCVVLSACGIKPSQVEPPEGSEPTQFPRTYPDKDTDPQPTPFQRSQY